MHAPARTNRFSIGLGSGSARLHDIAALLADVEARGLVLWGGHLDLTVEAEPEVAHTLLRNISTCREGCGCTVYSPRADCPDLECPCRVAA